MIIDLDDYDVIAIYDAITNRRVSRSRTSVGRKYHIWYRKKQETRKKQE